jgi:hypothetical protein
MVAMLVQMVAVLIQVKPVGIFVDMVGAGLEMAEFMEPLIGMIMQGLSQLGGT